MFEENAYINTPVFTTSCFPLNCTQGRQYLWQNYTVIATVNKVDVCLLKKKKKKTFTLSVLRIEGTRIIKSYWQLEIAFHLLLHYITIVLMSPAQVYEVLHVIFSMANETEPLPH